MNKITKKQAKELFKQHFNPKLDAQFFLIAKELRNGGCVVKLCYERSMWSNIKVEKSVLFLNGKAFENDKLISLINR